MLRENSVHLMIKLNLRDVKNHRRVFDPATKRIKMKNRNKKGQVWVETVIYTLIGLVLIGTVLSFITPAIKTQQDKAIVGRSVTALTELDNAIAKVKSAGISNARQLTFLIGEGTLTIDGANDQIIFQIDESSYAYSEVRTTVEISGTNLRARTVESGKDYDITLTLDYKDKLNITFAGEDKPISLGASPNPYILIVENLGKVPTNIDCSVDPLICDPFVCVLNLCRPKLNAISIYDAS